MKISQCMIVKNEEKNIEKALSWGRGVVDEQIVVDTGSTDRTVEIAEKMGAKIYHFEWINDFSAAKNYAIEQCTGDWIAFLDADEYFSDEDAKNLRKALECIDEIDTLDEIDITDKIDVIETPLVNLDAQGNIKDAAVQYRLFRNLPHIRYVNAIHEVLCSIDENQQLKYGKISVFFTIFHTGYASLDEDFKREKGNRNIALIEQSIEKEPEQAQHYMYMSEALVMLGEYKKAAEYAEKAIEIHKDNNTFLNVEAAYVSVMSYNARAFFSEGNTEPQESFIKRLERLYSESVRVLPKSPDPDFYLGHCYYRFDNYEKAAEFLGKCFDKLSSTQKSSNALLMYLQTLYFDLADIYFRLDDMPRFVKFAALAITEKKDKDDALVAKLIFALLKSGESVGSVFEFLGKLYDFESPADFTFVLKAAKMMQPPVLAEYMIENMPEKLRELM